MTSRRDSIIITVYNSISTRFMYDDLSLDYTYDQSYDLDEHYSSYDYDDLDEDYARDTQDFQELAYMHYA